MAVDKKHPEYEAAIQSWDLCRDTIKGARRIKERAGSYLARPSGMNEQDYRSYANRACYFNAMARTITALSGAVLNRPPSVELPDKLRPWLEDITMRNETLDDTALYAVSEILAVGRFGLLVDMGAAATVSARPYIAPIVAERIINWRTAAVGDDPDQLVQVVIREDVTVPGASGFEHETVERYRELVLNADGIYQQRLWTRPSKGHVVDPARTKWLPEEWITPVRRGQPLSYIPFTFIGPLGTVPDVAKPPLEDLATTVIAHFRNSADMEHALFLVSLPTPWASGIVGSEQPLKIGPSVCWQLEKDGRAGMLEFTGAGVGAIRDAMQAKEKQMSVLGGKLLLEEPHGQPETATSAKLRYSAESASLRTISSAVGSALTTALRWMVWWQGTDTELPVDVSVELSDDFFDMKASPEEVKAAFLAVQGDTMSFQTFYHILQKGGWTREGVTAEEELRAIAHEPTSY